jgi:hypothetical protein
VPRSAGDWFKEVLVPILTVVTAVLAALLTFKTESVQNELRANEAKISDRAEIRQELERKSALNFRIYDAVKASLEANSARQQEVAKVLVLAMADSSLRDPLLRVLGESAEPAVRREVQSILAEATRFQGAEDSLARRPSSGPGAMVFDCFWCEGSGVEGRQEANALAARIRERLGGTVRVRILPRSINLRPGYWVSGNEIRYDPAEAALADQLKTLLDPVVSRGGPFTTRRVGSQPTKNYISIFICGA